MNLGRIQVRWHSPGPARNLGFTLIELMVTLAIMAILAVVAAPSFNEALLSNRLASFANAFVASAQLARGEAIKRNAPVVLCRAAGAAGCAASGDWQQGWIVFADDGPGAHRGNGVLDSDETMLRYQQALSADYHFTGLAGGVSLNSLVFLPTGGVQTGGSFTLCRYAPAGRQERKIDVTLVGRTSVTRTQSGTCP